jgi:hypothetical protein
MPFELGSIKVHIPQIACGVTHSLITEMNRTGIAALSARGDRFGSNLRTELDCSDKAVASRPIPFLCPGIRAGAKRG